jgi:hypothetical protein
MKKYILGEAYNIGQEKCIGHICKIPNTPLEVYLYKKEFYNWACKQTKEQLADWRQHSIDAFKHVGDHELTIIWEHDYALLLEALEKFPTYQQYYEHTIQEYTCGCVEFVEETLLFDKNLLERKDKIYIYNVTRIYDQLDNHITRLLHFIEHSTHDIIIENERWLIGCLYKDIHSGTDSRTLQIFATILESMNKKQKELEETTTDKRKKKELKQKIRRIESFCEVIEIGGAPIDDIYRKNKRLAGAGWSNQK